jgi:DNA-binding transcriptional LysR family regulator
MELRHLRYFVAVAEELHFGRAAARLHVAQPALSQQIKHLEEELKVRLLERTKRRVALTEPGRAFLAEARRTLANAQSAVEVARRAARGEVGRLRVGYVDLAMWGALPGLLRRFTEAFPSVELALTELHREPQRQALLRGDLDVGFLTLREGDAELEGRLVSADPLVVALPEHHPLARRRRVPLAELAGEPWVTFPRELKTLYLDLTFATCAAAGFIPRVVQETAQLHSLTSLVSAGIGVTLVPSIVAEAARAGVAFRPLVGEAPTLPFHMVWPAGTLPPTARAFRDTVTTERAQPTR